MEIKQEKGIGGNRAKAFRNWQSNCFPCEIFFELKNITGNKSQAWGNTPWKVQGWGDKHSGKKHI